MSLDESLERSSPGLELRPMRPGEPLDWEFERWWLIANHGWPESMKRTVGHFFMLGHRLLHGRPTDGRLR